METAPVFWLKTHKVHLLEISRSSQLHLVVFLRNICSKWPLCCQVNLKISQNISDVTFITTTAKESHSVKINNRVKHLIDPWASLPADRKWGRVGDLWLPVDSGILKWVKGGEDDRSVIVQHTRCERILRGFPSARTWRCCRTQGECAASPRTSLFARTPFTRRAEQILLRTGVHYKTQKKLTDKLRL